MPARVDSLRESSHRVVRIVALGHLADATAARERIANANDDEALHDFRVALRRLRSWERAFRPYIRKDVSGKLRRRLRNLARDTGASRDLEVHLAWLREQRRAVGRRQRPGLTWLVSTLAKRKAEADAVLEDDVHGRFSKLHTRLERALASYRETLRVRDDGRAAPPSPFAEALAPRVRDAAALLLAQLQHIKSAADEDECHEARIAAKRLRYLLEPVTRLVPGADDAVERLKDLQDVLGDLHDAQVFGAEVSELAEELSPPVEVPVAAAPTTPTALTAPPGAAADANGTSSPSTGGAPAGPEGGSAAAPPNDQPATAAEPGSMPATTVAAAPSEPPAPTRQVAELLPGLTLIRERLRSRATAAFSRFSDEWLGGRSAGFFRDVDAVAERIAEGARAGMEVERKYLLRFVPEEVRAGRRIDIAQGYVPGAQLHERIRRVTVRRAGKPEQFFYRTVKLGEGVARIEIEEETTAAIFEAMWPLTRGHRLQKRRYALDVAGRTWEIDEFKHRDLVLAEIELESEDETVMIPKWLAAAVQREVTLEPAFQNINLAR
jgi:CHAD domain-containing protein/CYTH domain-containing protein